MNSYQIDELLKAGKMRLVFGDRERPWTIMSESLAVELVENNMTEFANFAYTDYGAIHGGMSDYAIIRFFEENYHGKGMSIEGSGWSGKNMILYGDALKYAREEISFGKDDFFSLISGIEDEYTQYQWEGICEEAAKLHKEERFAKYDEEYLARCIEECNSGQSNTPSPDYAESELLKRLEEGE